VPEIRRAAEHEGLTGLGPRRIIDVLSSAATAQIRGGREAPCIDPVTTLLALRREIDRMEMPAQERDALIGWVSTAREELDRVLKVEVQRAFVPAFSEKAEQIVENYLLNVEAYLQDVKATDPITGEERDPDENLMRSIEEQVGVSDVAKDEFRQGVMVRIGMAARQGRPLTYKTDGKLGEAIERRLFEEMRSIVRVTTSKVNPDRQQVERKNAVLEEMIRDRGYCTSCASAVLDYVGDLLNR
jgi:serine protein kinase